MLFRGERTQGTQNGTSAHSVSFETGLPALCVSRYDHKVHVVTCRVFYIACAVFYIGLIQVIAACWVAHRDELVIVFIKKTRCAARLARQSVSVGVGKLHYVKERLYLLRQPIRHHIDPGGFQRAEGGTRQYNGGAPVRTDFTGQSRNAPPKLFGHV